MAPELVDLDVARVLVKHVIGIHGVDRNVAACHGKSQQFVGVLTLDAQFHLRAFVATQSFHHLTIAYLGACCYRVVNHDNLVTRHQPDLFAGAAGDDLHHANGVVDHDKRDADATERAVQVVSSRLQVLGTEVVRVRIKVAQDLGNAQFYQVVQVSGVHIVLCDKVKDSVELAVVFGNWLVDVETAADEDAHHHRHGYGEG